MKSVIKQKQGGVQLSVNPKVYPLFSVYSAGYVFLDRAYVHLDKDKQGKIIVWLFPKKKRDDLTRLGMDFYNELLNYAHYFTNLKANSEILKTLVQRALFSAAPPLVQEAEEKEIQELINELEEEEKQAAKKK